MSRKWRKPFGAATGRRCARVLNQEPPPLYSISRGTGIRVFSAMPVVVQDRVAGVVYASRAPNNIVKHVYGERRKFILAGIAVLGATLAIGFIFWRVITRPIHALVARTAEVGHSNDGTSHPIAHHGTREIALLSQSFLDMAERLKERSDYIVTFAAHVSHELKMPLTAIQGAAELLRDASASSDAMTNAERMRFLDNIIADTNRLTAMLHRLRELARAENPQTHGSTTFAAIVADLRRAFPEIRVEAEGELDRSIAMSGENAMIVLSHLADNADRHDASTLKASAFSEGDMVRAEIRDDGEGISEKNRDKVFDAFFTTRRESGGTGMGLGIVQATLRAHGGSIRLIGSAKGAAFEIRIRTA
jgi:two-component system sensor histidine kinase CreC